MKKIDIFQKPKDAILQTVKTEAERLGDGEWIVSRGWNNILWVGGFPTKEELDAVSPKNPVSLRRVDGHSVWCNSLALELAGINETTPNPQGGEILKKPDGSLWGILTDTAAAIVIAIIPDEVSDERKLHRYEIAAKSLISFGLTTIVDAGEKYATIKLLEQLYQEGKVKVRVYEMLKTGEEILFINEGRKPVKDLFNGKFSINAVKLFSDGSLGSRSAWLLEDYSDRPGHKGNGRWTDDEMYNITKRAAEYGFQLGTHAIGDAAVHQVLTVQKRVIDELKLTNHRFRIEHFQIVDAADIPRAIEYGFIPSMQATHATSDLNMAEDRVGSVRILSSYAWKSVLNAGGIVADGSDAPVELVNPFHGIYAAVTRQDLEGNPPGGWYPEQRLTREEALKSFTIWGAFASFSENSKGSLEEGKYADFAVLDRDIINCLESEIKDITVLKTVIGGEVVYEDKAI